MVIAHVLFWASYSTFPYANSMFLFGKPKRVVPPVYNLRVIVIYIKIEFPLSAYVAMVGLILV